MKIRIPLPPWAKDAWIATQSNQRTHGTQLRSSFEDEFAPSYTLSHDGDDTVSETSFERLVTYNDHTLDTLGFILAQASKRLNLPAVPYGFPIQLADMSPAECQHCIVQVQKLVDKLQEGSPDWLLAACYIRWVQACQFQICGAPPQLVAERLFSAGATVRELELHLINKEHASRGRKTIRAAAEGGRQRHAVKNARTAKIVAEMRRLREAKPHLGVQWAAEQAFRNGIGTSMEANRALWYRNNKKRK